MLIGQVVGEKGNSYLHVRRVLAKKKVKLRKLPFVGKRERIYHLLNMGLAGRRQNRTAAGNKANLPLETMISSSSRVINACFQAHLLGLFEDHG